MWLAIIHLLAHCFVVQYSFGLRLKLYELAIFSAPLICALFGNPGIIAALPLYFAIVGPRYKSSTYIYCDIGRPSTQERRQISSADLDPTEILLLSYLL